MPAAVDIAGQEFGRLTAVRPCAANGRRAWECQCACGSKTLADAYRLRIGHVSSCGCWQRESRKRIKHGMSKSGMPEYYIWAAMKKRCTSAACKDFKNYGARGISVCERWGDFSAFFADMGARPTLKHSIDRIDVNGNYEPGNCRWATPVQQANNKRNNRKPNHV